MECLYYPIYPQTATKGGDLFLSHLISGIECLWSTEVRLSIALRKERNAAIESPAVDMAVTKWIS